MTESVDESPATRYDVFEVGSTEVALITDDSNERAWIQSTLSVPVER